MSAIEAVIFDLDGVLVDSEHVWDEVREELARERGGRWHERAQAEMMGMSSVEWSRYMHDVIGLAEPPEEIDAEVVRRMQARYAEDLPLDRRRGRGGATARRGVPARARVVLEPPADRRGARGGGHRSAFEATVSSEEVERGKPAPDVYLEAARRLGVAPERCAAIEDSANGIRAAACSADARHRDPEPRYPPPAEALALADRASARSTS